MKARHFSSLVFVFLVLFGQGSSALAATIFASNGTTLRSFDSSSPATATTPIPITGLQGGELILGLDFRPATGQLYGLGNTSRLYTLDPATGVATQVGTGAFTPALSGTSFGFDFNPVTDLIRVVSDADQNLRLPPDTNGVPVVDTLIAYDAGDPNAAANPNIVGLAYSNNFAGASSTTLFGIDASLDNLVMQGSPGGTPISPNSGTLFTVGSLGVDTSTDVGFDIAPDGTAFASLRVAGVYQLYTIDLSTGLATLVGNIGTGSDAIRSIAVKPEAGQLQMSAPSYTVNENGVTATITVTRTGGTDGVVTVDLATSDGTAAAGSDYNAVVQTVTFTNGDATDQTINIPIINDTLVEGNETVNLTLTNPTGGATLGTPSQAILTILDDDTGETCDNGIDDDGDNLVDCDDPDCSGSSVCSLDVSGGGCNLQNLHSTSNASAQLLLLSALAGIWLMRKRI